MDNLDVAGFTQLVLKLGLVTPAQLEEAREEAGASNDLQHLLQGLERKGYLTPFQRGKLLKGDIDGFFLSGYRVLYKIASGSFGRVFRADDPRSGRVVAIKILRRRWSEDKQRIGLFEREGRVGMSLKHPNIVEVLQVGHDPSSGQYFIVMEFVEGGNLRQILQVRKTLTAAESLRILEDATAGLVYAYARGVTHRDIKLTNLLISSHGEAKLVDFGLAQFFAALAKEEEKVDRTVDYAGLEKATGVKTGDVRSDIYFLGCVLYEMLTGRSPLVMTKDRHARMRRDRFENVSAIHPDEVNAPPSVLALVETMMALQPARRHQTPAQLLDAVRAARREVEGGKGDKAVDHTPRSVFVIERDESLQDRMREGFKKVGYRVFMAGEPTRALDRFRQQPYDALVVDAGTTGEEGLLVLERVLAEAVQKHLSCAAILMLNEDQAEWSGRVAALPRTAVIVRQPGLGFKHLLRQLQALVPSPEGETVKD